MEKKTLKDVSICGNYFETLTVFLDSNGNIIIIPLLYTIYLESVGEIIRCKEYEKEGELYRELYEDSISESSISQYIGHIFNFFQYIENLHIINEAPDVHHSHLIQVSLVNKYLNSHLPKRLTTTSLSVHQASIKSYFNFLSKLGLIIPMNIKISRKAKKQAFDNNRSQTKINYVSTEERAALLHRCKTKRDRLLLRMGFEVGLRTSENTGLLLQYNGNKDGYLLALFKDSLDSKKCHLEKFRYMLQGKYTKGGKSRWIFLSRPLLEAMRDYYLTERAIVLSDAKDKSDPDTLFLNADPGCKGEPIKENRATDVFDKYRDMIDWMDNELSYHDLRHTFATELYYYELINSEGGETRSQSSALITVAQRLGHALGKDGRPTPVTTRYIRLKEVMLDIEGGNHAI
ncbi:tyrosine-type recombinase/integrase [Pseudoalteromonas sp. K222D]|uniref:tyrosine-type recombinase/integrase n=1 Tax=Pseudoalteromonas sp. K222D TaxID=2820756 RepID=UPI001AD6B878|nr:site-specific integrase [Pseudoalteromonas sp. K222D]MBO7928057.1 tyrosine-type recombinase/integrase [Pseudoalteromonas sp. K222D]